MDDIKKLELPPRDSLVGYVMAGLPMVSQIEIEKALNSVERVEVGRILTDLFLTLARRHDAVTPEPLRHYLNQVLDPFPEYNNRQPDAEELQARQDRKGQRRESLRSAAQGLLDGFQDDVPGIARLSAWNAKASRLIDLIAGTITIENILNVSRAELNNQYENWDMLGRPKDFKFDFTLIPLFNERLFFLPKNMKSPEELFSKGEVLWNFRVLQSFLDVAEKCSYEIVITGHPTIATTKECSKIECEIFDAAREVTRGNQENFWNNFGLLLKSLDNYAMVVHTPVTPDGMQIRKFTVREEIENGAFMFERMFYNLRGARGTLHKTVNRVFGEEYTDEHHILFNMRLKVGSWLSGDVDGHSGKKAEHFLLEEIILRGQIARLYLESLDNLEKQGVQFKGENYKEIKTRLGKIQSTMEGLDQLLRGKETAGGTDIVLTQKEFDRISAEIYEAPALPTDSKRVNFADVIGQLEGAIASSYKEAPKDSKGEMIWLLRNVRTFQGHTAHLEQRQTSDVHTRVVDFLLTNPAFGDPANKDDLVQTRRAAAIDSILQAPLNIARNHAQAFLSGIDSTDLPQDDLRVYSKQNMRPITYHTLKRMQKALLSEGASENIIIAEAKGAENILEVLFLQEAAAEPDNKRRLKIIPLFEEYETLNKIPDTIFEALKYKSYRQHLLQMAGGDISKLEIEVMIAHSDNTKRAGTWASRASIHLAHHVQEILDGQANAIKELFAQDGVDTTNLQLQIRNYEGKSSSHANRAGVRAHTAMVDGFESHLDTKETVQGGDLHTVVMLMTNMQRRLAMHWSHVYKHTGRKDGTGRNGDWNPLIEEGVALAFQKTYEDFSRLYYNDAENLRGHLAVHPISSIQENKAVGAGSRPGSRSEGETPVYDPSGRTVPLKMTELRAISAVENEHDTQVQAALLASRNVENYLYQIFTGDKAMMAELQKQANELFHYPVTLFDDQTQSLTIKGADALRRLSIIHRECTDFAGYAAINARLEELDLRLQEAQRKHDIPVSRDIRTLMREFAKDYEAGAILILKSFNTPPPDLTGISDPLRRWTMLRNAIEEGPLNSVMQETDLKSRLSVLPMVGRDEILSRAWQENKRQTTATEKIILRDWIIGAMTSHHGYTSDASDPAMREVGRAIRNGRKIKPRAVGSLPQASLQVA